eukprot:469805-Prymnesium_polylepis.1
MKAVTFLCLVSGATASFNLASRPAGRGAEAVVIAASSAWHTLRSCQRSLPVAREKEEVRGESQRSFFASPAVSLRARPAGVAIGKAAIDAAMVSAAAARAQPRHTLSKRRAGVAVETFGITAARAAAAAKYHKARQQDGNA